MENREIKQNIQEALYILYIGELVDSKEFERNIVNKLLKYKYATLVYYENVYKLQITELGLITIKANLREKFKKEGTIIKDLNTMMRHIFTVRYEVVEKFEKNLLLECTNHYKIERNMLTLTDIGWAILFQSFDNVYIPAIKATLKENNETEGYILDFVISNREAVEFNDYSKLNYEEYKKFAEEKKQAIENSVKKRYINKK